MIKNMIAIHKSLGFAERWIKYCDENKIEYKLVDVYNSDIISQLSDCSALMWHFHHASHKDVLFSKQLLYSIEFSGKQVFPNFNTMWHFDDKIGQKYLLESIHAPIVPSYIFYSKKEALKWISLTTFPKVFKLRGGAGSQNVRLVNSKYAAKKLVNKSFGRGFSQYSAFTSLKERWRKYLLGNLTFWDVLKGIIRIFYTTDYARIRGREKGYMYFQEYIYGNNSDTRVVVIGNKAFAIKRMVRKNDFRASGSGEIFYSKELFDENTIKLAFDIAFKLKSQCVAFDFVYQNGSPLIIEISYGFTANGYDKCPGYWTSDMNWHNETFNPQGWMVQMLLN
jgi:glutathione synthase/RimK-type ligase-like ATP-grasp enzyme